MLGGMTSVAFPENGLLTGNGGMSFQVPDTLWSILPALQRANLTNAFSRFGPKGLSRYAQGQPWGEDLLTALQGVFGDKLRGGGYYRNSPNSAGAPSFAGGNDGVTGLARAMQATGGNDGITRAMSNQNEPQRGPRPMPVPPSPSGNMRPVVPTGFQSRPTNTNVPQFNPMNQGMSQQRSQLLQLLAGG